jgi:hypothetical protein
MKLQIELADNGYVLSYWDDELKDLRYIVVDDDSSDARITQKLLWEIIEYFNLSGSKHDEERCRVVIKNQKGKEIER